MIKIIIQHGKLLEPFFNFYVQNSPDVKDVGWKEWTPSDKVKVEHRIQTYKNIWAKYEDKILTGICSAFNLSFKRDFDVFIVAGINRSISRPLIISSHHSPNNFVVTLSHELIHRIFDDTDFKFDKILLVKGENRVINNHILIYAALRKIFEDEPEILGAVSDIKYQEDYKKAYKISQPYEEILKYFRENK